MRLDFVPQAKAAPLVIPATLLAVGTAGFAGGLFYLLEQALQNIDYSRTLQEGIHQASYASYEKPAQSSSPVQEVEGMFKYKVCMEQCVKAAPGLFGKVICAAVCTVALMAPGS